MADVFISYSRKDIEFAQRIHQELEARDREPWVDWQDIPPTAEWLDEVYAGIQAADTFLFIISPDSVVSEICTLEIEHAIQHNKRLVPVVLHGVADDQVHSAMSAHNWVFLREEDDFDAGFELLIDALDTDLDYVKEHTRLLTRAIEWDQDERARGLALSRRELQVAERWLTQGLSTEPKPTDLHGEYVDFSRTVVDRFQRLMVSSVTVAFVLMMGWSVFALYQRNQAGKEADAQRQLAEQAKGEADTQRQAAEKARERAEKIARIATSKSLAAFALVEMETDPELSLLLATESVKTTYDTSETVLPLSNTVLRQMIIKSRVRLTLKGHDDEVWSAAYSPDGKRIVTASNGHTAKVWDADTGEELFTLKGHKGWVTSAAYSPDGKRIVTDSYDKTAKVWDANTGKELFTLKGHERQLNSAIYSADGDRIVTASFDKTAKVWDAQTGQELMTLKGHEDWVYSAAYSPDGQRIVTGSGDKTAKVWDAITGQELFTLKGHDGSVKLAKFSPDGQRIVTASFDETAKVWDANTGQELMTLEGHEREVYSAAYSPDGQRIVTASDDKTAKVWDANTGKELFTLTGHYGAVWSASPDGKRIATAGLDGIVQIYTTDMDELLQIAESRVTRQLTAEEKERYGVLDLN
ncbi:TPA: TIR domain-containing protein [Candidatus Poribacteria bacterium]|nr:TIR domain-containing protein [Candidatus Poribacteria bacterium]